MGKVETTLTLFLTINRTLFLAENRLCSLLVSFVSILSRFYIGEPVLQCRKSLKLGHLDDAIDTIKCKMDSINNRLA